MTHGSLPFPVLRDALLEAFSSNFSGSHCRRPAVSSCNYAAGR
jgi:hypothetical protein